MTAPQRYNITWTTPSEDASGSIPLGNGDIGLNAWVEPNGDLRFYISKTDSWGDNGRLLKVGRIRFTLEPAPALASFAQTLHLESATLVVQYGAGSDDEVTLRLWVDANQPIIHLTVDSPHPRTVAAAIELWRTEAATLSEIEISDIMLDRSQPNHQHAPTVVEPDTLLTQQPNRIGWYHHNRKSVGPALTAEQQGLSAFERPDPLLDRIFGAIIQAENGDGITSERIDDQHLQSPTAPSHHFQIPVLTQHPATPEQWLAEIESILADSQQTSYAEQRTAHEQWWQDFWERSWIHVTSPAGDDDATFVSQAYALQRYLQACAGRGAYPIKFNGSIFNVPYPGKPGDADYRRWGGGYWWQNTRLPYFSMCAAGDFDLLQPLFQLYASDLFDLWRYRTQTYFGYDGIFFSECVYFWGDVFTETYGWTPFAERDDPLQESGYHKWEWVGGLELIWLMLDYIEHTDDQAFLQETLLPYAEQILIFFDHFYPTDEEGKLVMHPSQALETWWECTNPMSEVAGLQAVIARLLTLPEASLKPEQRNALSSLQQKAPELPIHEVDGTPMLAPADAFDDLRNVEHPELYAVFPFRLIAFNRPDLHLGLAALEHRSPQGHYGWRQDDLFMTYLGLAEEARTALVHRARLQNHDALAASNPERAMPNHSRFPAFWGPNYDWFPDQCHSGVFATTLQTMLLQCDGQQIYLFPAWPADWDVEFKLHAPYNTVVEGRYVNGKLQHLVITPPERAEDVTIVPKAGYLQ
ncbi:hypothetical protein KFU94_27140 [Chloroflexi bacterium TSY]|nr:hypothetical protein [Chloroflexi bacterium TSY]